jgi:hypothetical protein
MDSRRKLSYIGLKNPTTVARARCDSPTRARRRSSPPFRSTRRTEKHERGRRETPEGRGALKPLVGDRAREGGPSNWTSVVEIGFVWGRAFERWCARGGRRDAIGTRVSEDTDS